MLHTWTCWFATLLPPLRPGTVVAEFALFCLWICTDTDLVSDVFRCRWGGAPDSLSFDCEIRRAIRKEWVVSKGGGYGVVDCDITLAFRDKVLVWRIGDCFAKEVSRRGLSCSGVEDCTFVWLMMGRDVEIYLVAVSTPSSIRFTWDKSIPELSENRRFIPAVDCGMWREWMENFQAFKFYFNAFLDHQQ